MFSPFPSLLCPNMLSSGPYWSHGYRPIAPTSSPGSRRHSHTCHHRSVSLHQVAALQPRGEHHHQHLYLQHHPGPASGHHTLPHWRHQTPASARNHPSEPPHRYQNHNQADAAALWRCVRHGDGRLLAAPAAAAAADAEHPSSASAAADGARPGPPTSAGQTTRRCHRSASAADQGCPVVTAVGFKHANHCDVERWNAHIGVLLLLRSDAGDGTVSWGDRRRGSGRGRGKLSNTDLHSVLSHSVFV